MRGLLAQRELTRSELLDDEIAVLAMGDGDAELLVQRQCRPSRRSRKTVEVHQLQFSVEVVDVPVGMQDSCDAIQTRRSREAHTGPAHGKARSHRVAMTSAHHRSN